MICEFCKKHQEKIFGSGRFCSRSCSNKFSNSKSNKKETKKSNCTKCNKEYDINKHASPKNFTCEECKKKKKICKCCGQNVCERCDICKKFNLIPSLIKYFGFKKETVGTAKVYEEFERIRNLIIEDYIDNELSLLDLIKKYNHNNIRNFSKILNSLEIKRRNLSQASILAFKNLKSSPGINQRYKHGWHTTWNNKKVFYRSSHELEYCEYLDNNKIDYEVESLRILYWDSKTKVQRIAIPDFYLPDSNMIVEVKSTYTLNLQNMKDKKMSYDKHGYNFKMILEGQETEI